MSTLKTSRQRSAVLADLQSRYDHPTAEDVYMSVKDVIPTISLATVYRNLKLLESEGLILKIPTGESDRFDGHTHGHYHLTCLGCRKVLDLDIDPKVSLNALPRDFEGTVTSHSLMFYGICPDCKNSNKKYFPQVL